MRIYAYEVMGEEEMFNYAYDKLYEKDGCQVAVVDKYFLKNVLFMRSRIKQLEEFYNKYKAIIEGLKIKEEMGL